MNAVARALGVVMETAQASVPPAVFYRTALEQLGTLLPFDTSIYVPLPGRGLAPTHINKDRFIERAQRYYRTPGRYAESTRRSRAAAGALGGAFVDTEVFSARDRDRLPLYVDMLRPQGITSQVIALVQFRGRPLASIYLCRHGRVANFDADDYLRIVPLVTALGVADTALQPPEMAAPPELTRREHDIARLVCRGLRTDEIACVLGTSRHTVRNQLARLFAKLEVTTRAELVAQLVGK